MKKILGIISCLILVLVAGITFYACGGEAQQATILTKESEIELVIGDPNNQTKVVDFIMENYGGGSAQLNFSTDAMGLITYSSEYKDAGKTHLTITGVKPGTAVLTARSLQGNVTNTITIKVIQPITGLQLNPNYEGKLYVIKGGSLNLNQETLYKYSAPDTNQKELRFVINGEENNCEINDGILTVGEGCTASSISVSAISVYNEEIYQDFEVTILKPISVEVKVDGKDVVEDLSSDEATRATQTTNFLEIFPNELDGSSSPNSRIVYLTIKAGTEDQKLNIESIFNSGETKFTSNQTDYEYNNGFHIYTFLVQSASLTAGKVDGLTFKISYDGYDVGESNYSVSTMQLNLNSYNKPTSVNINGQAGEVEIDIFENSSDLLRGQMLEINILPGNLKSGENWITLWADNQETCPVSLYKLNATRTSYECVFGWDRSGVFVCNNKENEGPTKYAKITSGTKLYAFINNKYNRITNKEAKIYAQASEYYLTSNAGDINRALSAMQFVVNPNAQNIYLAGLDNGGVLGARTGSEERIVVEYGKISTHYIAIDPSTFIVGSSSTVKLSNSSIAILGKLTTHSSDSNYVYAKFTIDAQKVGATKLIVTLSDGKTKQFDLLVVSPLEQISIGVEDDVTQGGIVVESDIIALKDIPDGRVTVGENNPYIALNKIVLANSGGSGILLTKNTIPANAQYYLEYKFHDYILPEGETLQSITYGAIVWDLVTWGSESAIINTSRIKNSEIIEAIDSNTQGSTLVKISVYAMQTDGTYTENSVGEIYYLVNFFIKASGLEVKNGTIDLYSYESIGDKFVDANNINKSIGQIQVTVRARDSINLFPTYIDNLQIYVNGSFNSISNSFLNNVCYLDENASPCSISNAVLKIVRTLSNNTYTFNIQALKEGKGAYVFAFVLSEVDQNKKMTAIARVFVEDAVEITDIEVVNANTEDPIYVFNTHNIKSRSYFNSNADYQEYINSTEIQNLIKTYELELIYNVYSTQGDEIANKSLEFEFQWDYLSGGLTYVDENGETQPFVYMTEENVLTVKKVVLDYAGCFDSNNQRITGSVPQIVVFGASGFINIYPTSNYFNSTNGWNGEQPFVQVPINISDGKTLTTAIEIATPSDLNLLHMYPNSVFTVVYNLMPDEYEPVEYETVPEFSGQLFGHRKGEEEINTISISKPLFNVLTGTVQDLFIYASISGDNVLKNNANINGVRYIGAVANINRGQIINVGGSLGAMEQANQDFTFRITTFAVKDRSSANWEEPDSVNGVLLLEIAYHDFGGNSALSNCTVYTMVDYAGSLVGLNDYEGEVTYTRPIVTAGSVTGENVGGIVGENRGEISGATFLGINMGFKTSGGIAAKNSGTITDCTVQSYDWFCTMVMELPYGKAYKNTLDDEDLTGDSCYEKLDRSTQRLYAGGQDINVGGIAGISIGGEISRCKVEDFNSPDSIDYETTEEVIQMTNSLVVYKYGYVQDAYIGGLVGTLEDTKLTESMFTGRIGLKGSQSGALVGKLVADDDDTTCLVENCYADVKYYTQFITASTKADSFIYEGSLSEIKNCYVNSNILYFNVGYETTGNPIHSYTQKATEKRLIPLFIERLSTNKKNQFLNQLTWTYGGGKAYQERYDEMEGGTTEIEVTDLRPLICKLIYVQLSANYDICPQAVQDQIDVYFGTSVESERLALVANILSSINLSMADLVETINASIPLVFGGDDTVGFSEFLYAFYDQYAPNDIKESRKQQVQEFSAKILEWKTKLKAKEVDESYVLTTENVQDFSEYICAFIRIATGVYNEYIAVIEINDDWDLLDSVADQGGTVEIVKDGTPITVSIYGGLVALESLENAMIVDEYGLSVGVLSGPADNEDVTELFNILNKSTKLNYQEEIDIGFPVDDNGNPDLQAYINAGWSIADVYDTTQTTIWVVDSTAPGALPYLRNNIIFGRITNFDLDLTESQDPAKFITKVVDDENVVVLYFYETFSDLSEREFSMLNDRNFVSVNKLMSISNIQGVGVIAGYSLNNFFIKSSNREIIEVANGEIQIKGTGKVTLTISPKKFTSEKPEQTIEIYVIHPVTVSSEDQASNIDVYDGARANPAKEVKDNGQVNIDKDKVSYVTIGVTSSISLNHNIYEIKKDNLGIIAQIFKKVITYGESQEIVITDNQFAIGDTTYTIGDGIITDGEGNEIEVINNEFTIGATTYTISIKDTQESFDIYGLSAGADINKFALGVLTIKTNGDIDVSLGYLLRLSLSLQTVNQTLGFSPEDYSILNELLTESFVKDVNIKVSAHTEKIETAIDTAQIDPSNVLAIETTITTNKTQDEILVKIEEHTENGNTVVYSGSTEGLLKVRGDNTDLTDVDGDGKITTNIFIWVNEEQRTQITKTRYFTVTLSARYNDANETELVYTTVELVVKPQEIISATYTHHNRADNSSESGFTIQDEPSAVLAPGDSGLLSINLFPTYAAYKKVVITSQFVNNQHYVLFEQMYKTTDGSYLPTSGTIGYPNFRDQNSLTIYHSDAMARSNGMIYVRTKILNSVNEGLYFPITITIYAEDEEGNEYISKQETITLISQVIDGPQITIDGQKDAVVARAHTYPIQISVADYQSLSTYSIKNYNSSNRTTDSLSVIFNEAEYEVQNGRKIYNGTLTVGIDAEIEGDGLVQIETVVERIINGRLEHSTDSINVRIVDFTIDGVRIVGNSDDDNVFNTPVAIEKDLRFEFILSDIPAGLEGTGIERIREAQNYFLNNIAYKYLENSKDSENKDITYSYIINTDRTFILDNNSEDSLTHIVSPLGGNSIAYDLTHYDGTAYLRDNGTIQQAFQYFRLRYNGDADGTVLAADTIKVTGTKIGSEELRLMIAYRLPGLQDDMYFTYDFVINSQIYSDEDKPTPIQTADEFEAYLRNENQAYTTSNFILMNDIVLENFTPFETTNFASLDGNNKVITIRNFDLSQTTNSNSLNLGLFINVAKDSTLKNLVVNYYNLEDIIIDDSKFTNIRIGGLAVNNYGTIYNCEVVCVDNALANISNDRGIKVYFSSSNKAQPKQDTTSLTIAGFVVNNTQTGCITNSRVGGKEQFSQIKEDSGGNIVEIVYGYSPINIIGQGDIAGFVSDNIGVVAGSYFANGYIANNSISGATNRTAGFALNNGGGAMITGSYVEGIRASSDSSVYMTGGGIAAQWISAGFIYENAGTISDSYANIRLVGDNTGRIVSGFVYSNTEQGSIARCYAASTIVGELTTQMPFSGKNAREEIMQKASNGLVDCYYMVLRYDTQSALEERYNTGAIALQISSLKSSMFYGFAFTSQNNENDGVWSWEGFTPQLTSANQIAISVRKIIKNYSTLVGSGTNIQSLNVFPYLSGYEYGSSNNPIIIRTANEYNRIFGQETNLVQGAYYAISQMYNKSLGIAFGSYRLVSHINFDQLTNVENVKISSSIMTLMPNTQYLGIFDGNGLTISNVEISLNSHSAIGLFAQLQNGGVFKNVAIRVKSIAAGAGIYVGGAVGKVENSSIINVAVSAEILEGENRSKILGHNIVGGVVGSVIGKSRISNLSSSISVVSTYIPATADIPNYIRNNLVVENNVVVDRNNKISFAGGVIGLLDIYEYISSNRVTSSTPNASKLNYYGANVYVQGDIVGGVVGYVGQSTYLVDASFELTGNATTLNQKLISYGNTIGGIVGINKGDLYELKIEHQSDTQELIEANLENYYNNTNNTFRGNTKLFNSTTNNLKYIGGLVGRMIKGNLTVSYSRVDVSNVNAEYAGGIIGQNKSNTVFDQLYAFGDVDCKVPTDGETDADEETAAGGLIGHNDNAPNMSFYRCVAMNFYSKTNSIISNAIESIAPPATVSLTNLGVLVGKGVFSSNNLIEVYGNKEFLYKNYKIKLKDEQGSTASLLTLDLSEYKGVELDATIVNKMFLNGLWDSKLWELKDNRLLPTFSYGIANQTVYIEKTIDLLKLNQYNRVGNIVIFGDDPNTAFDPFDYDGTSKTTGEYFLADMIGFDVNLDTKTFTFDLSQIVEFLPVSNEAYFSQFGGTIRTVMPEDEYWKFIITGMDRPLFSNITGGSVSGLTFEGRNPENVESNTINGPAVLAREISNQTELSNLTFKNIKISSGESNMGILAGQIENVFVIKDITITNCLIANSTTGTYVNVGGVVGCATRDNSHAHTDIDFGNIKIENGLSISIGGTTPTSVSAGIFFGSSSVNTKYTNCAIPTGCSITIANCGTSGNSYVGGFTGNAQGTHAIMKPEGTEITTLITNLLITVDGGNNLKAGLMFGSVGTFQGVGADGKTDANLGITISGKITVGNATSSIVSQIGGIAGLCGSGAFNGITVNGVDDNDPDTIDDIILIDAKTQTGAQNSSEGEGEANQISSIGGAVGYATGSITLKNITVSGNINVGNAPNAGNESTDAILTVGGIIGSTLSATADNSTPANEVTISGVSSSSTINIDSTNKVEKLYVGGIAGAIIGDIVNYDDADNSQDRNNLINGNINIDSTNKVVTSLYAGGVAGKVVGDVKNNYAWGNVTIADAITITNLYIGGIVGDLSGATQNDKATFENNYSLTSIYNENYATANHHVRALIGKNTNVTASTNFYCHQINLATDTIGTNCYYSSILSYFLIDSKDLLGRNITSGAKLNPKTTLDTTTGNGITTINKYYYAVSSITAGYNVAVGAHICGDGAIITASITPFGTNDGYIAGFTIITTSASHLNSTVRGVATTNNGIIFAVTATAKAKSNWLLSWNTMVTSGGSFDAGFVETNNGYIGDCSAMLNVYAATAGFVETNEGVISNSYATGAIYKATGSAFVETNSGKIYNSYTALDGTITTGGTINNFYYDCWAGGQTSGGGTGYDTNQMAMKNGDIYPTQVETTTFISKLNTTYHSSSTNVWAQNDAYNFGYPTLSTGAYTNFGYMKLNAEEGYEVTTYHTETTYDYLLNTYYQYAISINGTVVQYYWVRNTANYIWPGEGNPTVLDLTLTVNGYYIFHLSDFSIQVKVNGNNTASINAFHISSIQIPNAGKLNQMLNGKTSSSDMILLTNMDLSNVKEWNSESKKWESISSWAPATYSNATFDGNNYKILNIPSITKNGVAGFFGVVTNATICNCDFIYESLATVKTTNAQSSGNAGGVAGSLVGGSRLENVTSSGATIKKESGTEGSIGGLVGYLEGSYINNDNSTTCANYNKVNSSAFAGGIVGYVNNNPANRVNNCFNFGQVTGTTAGGIVGQIDNGTIKNCYNYGEIEGSEKVGGILGYYKENTTTSTSNTSSNIARSGNPSGQVHTWNNVKIEVTSWTNNDNKQFQFNINYLDVLVGSGSGSTYALFDTYTAPEITLNNGIKINVTVEVHTNDLSSYFIATITLTEITTPDAPVNNCHNAGTATLTGLDDYNGKRRQFINSAGKVVYVSREGAEGYYLLLKVSGQTSVKMSYVENVSTTVQNAQFLLPGDNKVEITENTTINYSDPNLWSNHYSDATGEGDNPDYFLYDSDENDENDENDAINIYTAKGLAFFANNLGEYGSYAVKLMADIDLSDYIWAPILIIKNESSVNVTGSPDPHFGGVITFEEISLDGFTIQAIIINGDEHILVDNELYDGHEVTIGGKKISFTKGGTYSGTYSVTTNRFTGTFNFNGYSVYGCGIGLFERALALGKLLNKNNNSIISGELAKYYE